MSMNSGQLRTMTFCMLFLNYIAWIGAARAQELPTAKPASVGLSAERLERIGQAVQRDIDDKRIAGAVTLVMRHS